MKNSLDTVVADPDLGLVHRLRSPAVDTPEKAPALLLLHGVGANEAGLIPFAQGQDPRLAVFLLRAPLAFGPGQFGWFQVSFTAAGPVIDRAQAEQSRRLLIDFVRRLPAAYGVDPQRLWIAGFSQGGIMSASAALTAPTEFAGFGILSGRILPEIAPLVGDAAALKELPAFVAHGRYDDKLGIHFARSAREQLTALGLPLHYREYDAGHELNAAMQRDFGDWMAGQLAAGPAA